MTTPFPRGRAANPFAVSRVAPHRAGFVFPAHESPTTLLDRFAAHRYRGEIAAPQGRGKTTLLWTLAREAARLGHPVAIVRLGEAGTPALHRLDSEGTLTPLLFLDVARIAPAVALALRFLPRRSAILTAHRPTGFGLTYCVPFAAEPFAAWAAGLAGEQWRRPAAQTYAAFDGDARSALARLYGEWETASPLLFQSRF